MIIEHHEQGSEAWLQARAGVITASRFSDARARLEKASKSGKAGDPASKALDYAWTIAMERIAGAPLDRTFVTWQMERGTRLEGEARIAYEARGELVDEAGIAFTEDRAFGYSTDGFVGEDGMVEIKCPASCTKLGSIWTHPETAEAEYIDQINGGLWITGRDWCDLIVYCPWLAPVGKELFVKRIERDEDAIDTLVGDLLRFKALVDGYEEQLRKEAA